MVRECEVERLERGDSGGIRLVEQVAGGVTNVVVCESLPQRPVGSSPAPHVRVTQHSLVLQIWMAKRTGLQTSHMLIKKLIKTHEFLRTYGLFKVDPRLMLS